MKYVAAGFVVGALVVTGWRAATQWYWRRADIEGALAAIEAMYAWPTEGR